MLDCRDCPAVRRDVRPDAVAAGGDIQRRVVRCNRYPRRAAGRVRTAAGRRSGSRRSARQWRPSPPVAQARAARRGAFPDRRTSASRRVSSERSPAPRASITPTAAIRVPSASTTAVDSTVAASPRTMVPGGSRCASRSAKSARLDGIVALVERAAVAGKGNGVALPAGRDERRDDPAIGGCDVAREEGPDVVAADRIPGSIRRTVSSGRRSASAAAISPPASPPPTIARSQLWEGAIEGIPTVDRDDVQKPWRMHR